MWKSIILIEKLQKLKKEENNKSGENFVGKLKIKKLKTNKWQNRNKKIKNRNCQGTNNRKEILVITKNCYEDLHSSRKQPSKEVKRNLITKIKNVNSELHLEVSKTKIKKILKKIMKTKYQVETLLQWKC